MEIIKFAPKINEFSIRKILKVAWNIFKTNPGKIIFITLFVLGFSGFFEYVRNTASLKFGSLMQVFIFALVIIAQLVLSMGLTNVAIRIVRRKHYSLGHVFGPGEVFINYLVGSLIYGMVLLAGFLISMQIISLGNWQNPGLQSIVGIFFTILWYFIFGIKFMFYSYIIVDKKIKVFDAFKLSASLTRGLSGKLMMLIIALAIINVLGGMLFFVGLIVTIPVSLIGMAVVYLMLLEHKESYDALNRVDPETVIASKH